MPQLWLALLELNSDVSGKLPRLISSASLSSLEPLSRLRQDRCPYFSGDDCLRPLAYKNYTISRSKPKAPPTILPQSPSPSSSTARSLYLKTPCSIYSTQSHHTILSSLILHRAVHLNHSHIPAKSYFGFLILLPHRHTCIRNLAFFT